MASRASLRESRPHRRSKARRRDDAVSVNAAYLKRFKQSASQCRSPRQFRELLDEVQTFVPYQRLVSLWGYPSSETIRYIFNHSFPVEFIRWYLTKGMLWKGPVFREWLRTNRPQTSVDILRRLAKVWIRHPYASQEVPRHECHGRRAQDPPALDLFCDVHALGTTMPRLPFQV